MSAPWSAVVREVTEEIDRTKFLFEDEKQLQAGLARMLDWSGFRYERECRLTGTDVVDFLVLPRGAPEWGGGPDLALEVKVGGSSAALTRQAYRYAASERVGAVLVVTTRSKHVDLPTSMLGKPMFSHLIRSGL